VCQLCWSQAAKTMDTSGAVQDEVKKKDAELDKLRRKLSDSNLQSMRQLTMLRDGKHSAELTASAQSLMAESVTFYEPLQYLDESTRDLVFTIICDKLRQIENGTAPQPLLDAIRAFAEAGAKKNVKRSKMLRKTMFGKCFMMPRTKLP